MNDYDKFIQALNGKSFSHGEGQNRMWIKFTTDNTTFTYYFDQWGYFVDVKSEMAGTLHKLT